MSAFADRSDDIDLIAAAFTAAAAEFTDIPKTKQAETGKYGYKYATIADALDVARPVLAKHGLAITQAAEVLDGEAVIWTTLLHASGQFLTAAPTRLPAGPTAQSTGSAITYGRRYAMLAVLGLATEDDDGASAGVRQPPSAAPSRAALGSRAREAARPVGTRSPEEARIRAIVASIPSPILGQFKADFEAEFGCLLIDLPVDRHAEALRWTRDHAPVEVPDDEDDQ